MDFDGITEKLKRADENIQNLQLEISLFFQKCKCLGIVMASERGIGDAVDEPRVLPDQAVNDFALTSVLTAWHRYGLAQDCLSRHQSLDLNHEDCRGVGFVQVFLGEERL